jgi:GrpB-like predicted nucleotidyltransferase (UPF0157 family)
MLVEPYNPSWPSWFNRLDAYFRSALGDLALRIEHVGSTSIPGLTAKPIIDVDIVIEPRTFDSVKTALARAGYEHEGDLGIPDRDAFKPADPEIVSTYPNHHPYVCSTESQELARHLLFRDFMRNSPEYVKQLSELKHDLCLRFDNDRDAYIDSKAPFYAEIRHQALLTLPEPYCPPTLGLKRGTVRLENHNRDWARVYENEEKLLRYHVDDLVDHIEHVGSTSVPGLMAKPIIDIAIAIPERDGFETLKNRMVDIGYLYRGDKGNQGGWLLVREGATDVRYIHTHVVETSDPQWTHDYIGYRDLLRSDAEARQAYEQLKTTNGERFRDDRRAYTADKEDFVRGLLDNLKERDEPGLGE